jgi:murein L,D-transpeptidase YcbB/YkuD
MVDTASIYKAALKQFQTDQGLTPDGVLGVMTANRLVQANGC